MVRPLRTEKRITDQVLLDAVDRAERGLIDADLGGGLIKQRVARPGRGKSKGYRVLIGFRTKERAALVFGFAKSDLENLDADVLDAYRTLASDILERSDREIEIRLASGSLTEVTRDGEAD